ncbi:hypothetical protein MLD38_034842 [Melastoma candidum]|uniref:Uncharacterized protein n=1 Tax=Melastoma candidum TaxID=119954 RepID=A0ACB9MD67_9MYRT|nr:hypothetical protein MLD38_034842 [Melastoma candidum]
MYYLGDEIYRIIPEQSASLHRDPLHAFIQCSCHIIREGLPRASLWEVHGLLPHVLRHAQGSVATINAKRTILLVDKCPTGFKCGINY